MPYSKLIALTNPKSSISEIYRIIRTNIMFSSLDRPLKSFLVTSSGPGEGKSVTAANLAVVFAQSGKRVLLVDADLRKPSQHHIFDLNNDRGVTSVLLGDAGLEEALHVVPETRLSVLTTGPIPPNPAELLGSEKMKLFLEELQKRADLVIVDTPPLMAVTDAALMASRVDGVVLVLSSGKVKIELARKAKELLLNVKARILGTVLNMVDGSNPDYYYYYYHRGKRKKKSSIGRRLLGSDSH